MGQRRNIPFMVIQYAVAAVLILFAVLPFLWVIATSFNAAKSLLGAHFIPEHLTVGNYTDLLSSTTLNFSLWMVNSFKISTISVLLIVSITCLSAYALSRFRFKGKKTVLMAIMILNVFPGILAMIAVYNVIQQVGNYVPFLGLNTHGGLILLYVSGAMSINVLMVKAYIDTIPVELDESAYIEGATALQTFMKITFPVIRPMVVTIGILAFMSTYGDFIVANLLLKGNENITVMVGIYQFTQQRFDTNWGIVTAGTVIAALPVTIMFFFAQKSILSGVVAGAVKE